MMGIGQDGKKQMMGGNGQVVVVFDGRAWEEREKAAN